MGYRRCHRDPGPQNPWHEVRAITPCLWEAAGHTWRPHRASVPRVRRAELFTQDPSSRAATKEGGRVTQGHSVPGAGQTAWVFSPRNLEPGGREQPEQSGWGTGVFPGPLGFVAGHPGGPRSRTSGASGPIQAPPEDVLRQDPGLGGDEPGDPSQVYPFTLLVPACAQGPRHHPSPTPPPKPRGPCHSAAKELLVQPGVGGQGRPGSVGKALRSARHSRTLSCVHLSSDGLPCGLPHHPKKSQFPTFPTLDLLLSP